MQVLAEILLYITVNDELDTPSTLDLRHDLQEFVRDNPGKYEIWLFDEILTAPKPRGKHTVIL